MVAMVAPVAGGKGVLIVCGQKLLDYCFGREMDFERIKRKILSEL